LDYFVQHFKLPVRIETDVNAAAIAEGKWGAATGEIDYAYITIGTGIGGGLIHNLTPIFGMSHPEIGHMMIKHSSSDPFPGNCPYHTDCLEGLANAPALKARWNADPSLLSDDHPAWNLEAYYLGQMINNLVMTCSPRKIILGGGVMKRPGLIEKVRDQFRLVLQSYIQSPYLENLDEYIVPPALGDLAGALGAVALVIE
jgi:fructokinase